MWVKLDKDRKQYDCCVLCGSLTEYDKNIPVDLRKYYVVGSGQLCKDCYQDVYGKNKLSQK